MATKTTKKGAKKTAQSTHKPLPKTETTNKNLMYAGLAFIIGLILYSSKTNAQNTNNNFDFDYGSGNNSGSGTQYGNNPNSNSGSNPGQGIPTDGSAAVANVLITDFDAVWEYSLIDGIWWTRRKGNIEWLNMKERLTNANYNLAVDRLTAHLRKQNKNF